MPTEGKNVELLQGTLDLIERELGRQTERWRRLAGLVDKLLLEASGVNPAATRREAQ